VAAWRQARRRYGWLDHVVRAAVRYDRADGGRLAAAVTYYAFFATFALALLGFAVFGFVLADPAVLRAVQRYLAQNLPRLDVQTLRDARGTVGLIAFVGLPVTGWFWVDALRSSIRRMWRLPEYPGSFLVRLFVDLLVLVGLGLLLAASLAVAFVTAALAGRLVSAADTDTAAARWLLATVGFVLGVGVNTVLSIAVLTALPRLRMPLRRVLGPALLVAAGLEVLKSLGRLYVQHAEANPTYRVVAGAVGLLVFLNVVNQLVLYAAALTATATAGRVTDMAAGAAPTRVYRRGRVRVRDHRGTIRRSGRGVGRDHHRVRRRFTPPVDEVADAGVEDRDDRHGDEGADDRDERRQENQGGQRQSERYPQDQQRHADPDRVDERHQDGCLDIGDERQPGLLAGTGDRRPRRPGQQTDDEPPDPRAIAQEEERGEQHQERG
jgi:membrane protein